MKNNMKDLRGFTLIELLAVIVVLAIIMLIAVNAVLPQMEKARRSSFAIEANGAIQAAQTYFMAQNLTAGKGLPTTDGGISCVTIDELIKSGDSDLDDDYEGKVIVKKGTRDNNNQYYYYVWLRNKTSDMMVVPPDASYTGEVKYDVEYKDVVDFDNSTGNGKWKLTADNTTKYGTDGATCPTPSP